MKELTVRFQNEYVLRNNVYDLPKLLLALSNLFLGPLSVLDVGTCTVPPKEASRFIAQRIVSDQKPAILPVFSLDSSLQLKRGSLQTCALTDGF